MKQDHGQDSWFTTLFDYYALPNDFPGYATLPPGDAAVRIARLQTAMTNDIVARFAGFPSAGQFIPYIQQHEFEALLFSDPSAFRVTMPDNPAALERLTGIRSGFATPPGLRPLGISTMGRKPRHRNGSRRCGRGIKNQLTACW